MTTFDLEKFKTRWRAEASDPQRPKKRRRRKFVQVPWSWVEKLVSSRSANTYRLALYLLYENFKDDGKPIKLSNGGAKEGADITRYAKRRALLELETLGLVRIERHPRRSPLVSCIKVE
jgi:hypothetical protein